MNAPVFTPNTEPGGEYRYVLYRRGHGLFSITPDGRKFRGAERPDACGLGCYCGAYVEPKTDSGRRLIVKAAMIDSMSKKIREATP